MPVTPATTAQHAIPLEALRAVWDNLPNIDDVKPEHLRDAMFAALPILEQKLRKQLGRELDVLMNTGHVRGCACPASSQKSCGWREGIGQAADLVRGES